MGACGIITLITDFGLGDSYAGALKGAILCVNPRAVLVDINHNIPRGSIADAAMAVLENYAFFPPGTVHLAVVDPGVGSRRRPIAAEGGGYFFVGPDNGVLWPVIDKLQARAVHLTDPRYFRKQISTTFHGRDIFGPVAAWISAGADISSMGPAIADPVRLETEEPFVEGGRLHGRIIRADVFGNLVSNLRRETVLKFIGHGQPHIRVGGLELFHIHRTYSSVPEGTLLALFGSSGLLEVAVNGGSAAQSLAPDQPKDIEITIDGPDMVGPRVDPRD